MSNPKAHSSQRNTVKPWKGQPLLNVKRFTSVAQENMHWAKTVSFSFGKSSNLNGEIKIKQKTERIEENTYYS